MNWGDLALGFIVGTMSSVAVAYFVYQRQRKDSEEVERRIVLLLSSQQNLSDEIISSVHEVTKKQIEIAKDFKSIKRNFQKAIASQDFIKSFELAREYTRVAGSIAEHSIESLLMMPPSSINLTIESLLQLHKSLFPQNYELGGALRKIIVWIGAPGSTLETARYISPPVRQVPTLLSELLSWWNTSFDQLRSAQEDKRIGALTEFHYRFLSIHPFQDGNGRMARLLLGMQSNDLFGKPIDLFNIDRKMYYDALYSYDKKDNTKLRMIIEDLVKNKKGDIPRSR